MGKGAKEYAGRPRNTFKKDFILYTGGGFGGGGGPTLASPNRYTFWVDHNRFAARILKLIAQNVSFNVYTDGTGVTTKPVWISIDQSNDKPDELIKASVGAAQNNALLIPTSSPPPYYINTNFLTQPTDRNYQNDQGRWVYDGYAGNGLGLGASGKIVQSFIPQSSLLTAVWIRDLFHVGVSTDHTLYQDLVVEIWDKNKNVIATATISRLAHQLDGTADYGTEYFLTADDGLAYWTEFSQIRVKFGVGAKVEIGATHYICIKQSASTVAHQYAVGSNTNSSGVYPDSLHTGSGRRYIWGQAYTAPYASTTLTAIGTDISVCFTTQRPNGRTAYTFMWDDPGYLYDPTLFKGQFKLIKEDFEQVI